jgi:hypothetical protein
VQHARVVFAAPDRSDSAERSVEGTGRPDAKPRHAEGQRSLVGGLNDRVDVIDLDGELNDPKFVARRSGYRRCQRGERPRRAERRQAVAGSKRDMHGMARIVLRSPPVGHR